ncbi:MAG TPA: hypothetical protein VHE81_07065, partial [Lacipirellulaceae bacterium]|nr:hypothetical protein [Lacipirellulaceae bacterium]
ILAMRQLVHDTKYDPAELDVAGWPLRWHAQPNSGPNAWKVEKSIVGNEVRQKYSVDAAADSDSWLRYENLVPTYDIWQQVADSRQQGNKQPLFSDADRAKYRRLIMDANPYDGRVDRNRMIDTSLQVDPLKQGLHWVGDLMMEANVHIESNSGVLLFDLVEGGKHFTCRINVADGEAQLSADDDASFAPKAKTSIVGPGKYVVAFSNFDDQLLLWVDGNVISFDGDTAYNVDKVFGSRENIIPQTSDKDLGDFAPVGIGARGAKISVNRLRVWRDIYYIADDYQRMQAFEPVTDYNHSPFNREVLDLATDPATWNLFRNRHKAYFTLNDRQLFPMGDNSAESSDARLWVNSERGKPGGPYLDRRLLIGKALCVYWPHSWNRIPGTPIPFPLFPNVADMRLVR